MNKKCLGPFKLWTIENFPFIEADFDAITNYQLYSKIVEYVQKIADNQNILQHEIDYVIEYFNNLDVQEEVNKKLDEMAEDGTLTELIGNYVNPIFEEFTNSINSEFGNFKNIVSNEIEEFEDSVNDNIDTFENSVNTSISQISALVDSANSGSPLVASNTSEMTDTTKVYVNTTDGKWYYYDGDSWEIGGTYQATAIAEDSINKYQLNSNLKNNLFKRFGGRNLFETNYDITNFTYNSGVIGSGDKIRSIVIPVTGGKRYYLGLSNTSQHSSLMTTANYPENSETVIDYFTSFTQNNDYGIKYRVIDVDATANYLTLYFYNTDDTVVYETILASLFCYDLETYEKELSYPKYNEEEINNKVNELNNAIYNTLPSEDLLNHYDLSQIEHILPSAQNEFYVYGNVTGSIVFPIKTNTSYLIKRDIVLSRFGVSLASEYPIASYTEFHDNQQNNSGASLTVNNTTYKYMVIQFYRSTSDDISLEEALKTIHIYEGTEINTPSYKYENMLSDSYIKLVSQKYLGTLTKGYIAISSDDGGNDLADITVDIFKGYKTQYGKNIPLTMGLMQTSPIFSDLTRKNKVLDLIENYGASVAIHGSSSYTTYTQTELYNFLNSQKDFLTSNLSAPSSIIYPNHAYSELSSTIAGSFYGVCATGGTNTPITYNGNNKVNGPRSNMYTLYRVSLFNESMTNQKIKDAIDYASENNMIFMPFFHDNMLNTDYERCKALLDYCIDYANTKGLTFINIGDIPFII